MSRYTCHVEGPRNRKAYRQSRRLRNAIIGVLEKRTPLQRPFTAAEIRDRLHHYPLPSERTIQRHLNDIWDEAEEWAEEFESALSEHRIGDG